MEDTAIQAQEAEKFTPKKALSGAERSDLKKARCGRKPMFRQIMLDEAYILGSRGFTLQELADFWKISRMTLHRWTKKYPKLQIEIQRGKIQADEQVIKALFDAAIAGNVTAQIFWLKNRLPAQWGNVKKSAGNGVGGDTHLHIDRRVFFTANPEDADPDGITWST